VQKERERLSTQGVECIEIQIIDMSVLVQGQKKQLNRIIFNTELEFEEVENLLISPSQPVPMKPGFQYANILLFFKGKPVNQPILFPYVYKTRLRKAGGKNNLKHWILVNNQCKESYHLIKNFTNIGEN